MQMEGEAQERFKYTCSAEEGLQQRGIDVISKMHGGGRAST